MAISYVTIRWDSEAGGNIDADPGSLSIEVMWDLLHLEPVGAGEKHFKVDRREGRDDVTFSIAHDCPLICKAIGNGNARVATSGSMPQFCLVAPGDRSTLKIPTVDYRGKSIHDVLKWVESAEDQLSKVIQEGMNRYSAYGCFTGRIDRTLMGRLPACEADIRIRDIDRNQAGMGREDIVPHTLPAGMPLVRWTSMPLIQGRKVITLREPASDEWVSEAVVKNGVMTDLGVIRLKQGTGGRAILVVDEQNQPIPDALVLVLGFCAAPDLAKAAWRMYELAIAPAGSGAGSFRVVSVPADITEFEITVAIAGRSNFTTTVPSDQNVITVRVPEEGHR